MTDPVTRGGPGRTPQPRADSGTDTGQVPEWPDAAARERIAEAEATGTFSYLGETWDFAPGVFLPTTSYATAFFAQRLPYPRGGTFLEVGCGAGVTAVYAARAGCADVLAVDVEPHAVVATRRNARRHRTPQVRAKTGDVFDALGPDDGPFDLVFWALPYVSLPEGSPPPSSYARGVEDVGHYCCRTYLAGARRHLAPGGRLFLGLGDISDEEALHSLAAAHGFRAELTDRGRGTPGDGIDDPVEHRLYELLPVAGTA
ncbi:methyltransferase domain-containing protein [Streptomyces albus]|uniref:Methyltransferase domain-containing protein n=1 Tax=Streptomyces albus TaxID=1888 RepID=A0A8H1QT01_9ACTN|nr:MULTISPECIES: methyltransferase domain-containing protein [Streptomyces]EPD91860.1 hypothetical protein HMPREF1486_04819 [Streptomyces sp. HPH0547]TGG86449.1 methyltransferase domain-containing protein [Streptomyces albus]UVN53197.1 methyltransferase domain-containing protein [Streptomyces albus]